MQSWLNLETWKTDAGCFLRYHASCVTVFRARAASEARPDQRRRRYTARDLLENIVEPSRVINEQYGLQIYQMKDGSTYTGRTVNMAGDTVMITTNPNDPGGSEVRFSIHDLEASTPTRVSFMPEGLLNTLTHDEILDLLAYLRSSQ